MSEDSQKFVLDDDETRRAIGDPSPSTWERMKRRGDAPVKTQISPRRIGYRVEDIKAWLDKRRREPQAQRREKCRDTLDMFEPIGDAAADIVRKLEGSADIRDHSIKMQRKLKRQNKGE